MSPNGIDKKSRLQTVAETRAFRADIDALLSADDRDAVIVGIASDPEGGDLIPAPAACASVAYHFRAVASGAARG